MRAVDPFVYAGLIDDDKLTVRIGIDARSSDKVIRAVCVVMEIKEKDLISRSRPENLVWGRAIAYKILRTYGKMTLPKIGKLFDRDHSTVINGLRAFDDLNKFNKDFKSLYRKVKKILAYD